MQKKILVVDDERDVLTVVSKRLSDAGYFVITATNGKDAIWIAKKERPNLILLDIMMPDMDGGQVGYTLKNIPETKDIPVVFLTCLISKDEEKKGSNVIAGNYFIAKPYNPEDLLKEIGKHIA